VAKSENNRPCSVKVTFVEDEGYKKLQSGCEELSSILDRAKEILAELEVVELTPTLK